MVLKYLMSAGAIAITVAATIPSARADYVLTGTIGIPASRDNSVGGKFSSYDISFFDPLTQLDYVADRSNAAVDIFSAVSDVFVGKLILLARNNLSHPNYPSTVIPRWEKPS